MKHVDEFIDDSYHDMDGKNTYARWVLNYFRLPATLKNDFRQFMKDHKLFCTWKGKRYRCTGASRLGDVWLAENFEREHGYDHRVDVAECTDWKDAA